jgi:hypothetical protein
MVMCIQVYLTHPFRTSQQTRHYSKLTAISKLACRGA